MVGDGATSGATKRLTEVLGGDAHVAHPLHCPYTLMLRGLLLRLSDR